MYNKQFDACKEILKAEIYSYKPTHILFMTGYDLWYAYKACNFSSIFSDNRRIGSNKDDKKIFVEGTAKFDLDGKIIPVVISCRPEQRNESDFTSAVVDAFRR